MSELRVKLLDIGRLVEVNPERFHLLREVVMLLSSEGHAVVYNDEIVGSRVVKAEALHYLSCAKCKGKVA